MMSCCRYTADDIAYADYDAFDAATLLFSSPLTGIS